MDPKEFTRLAPDRLVPTIGGAQALYLEDLESRFAAHRHRNEPPHWLRDSTMQRLDVGKVIECASAAEWEARLEQHHASEPEVWLRLAKKGDGARTVSRAEALE